LTGITCLVLAAVAAQFPVNASVHGLVSEDCQSGETVEV
jgi:hypothetical protein